MTASNTFTRKSRKEKNDDLSKNHQYKIKYRKRVQEDKEKEEEVKEYQKNNADSTF